MGKQEVIRSILHFQLTGGAVYLEANQHPDIVANQFKYKLDLQADMQPQFRILTCGGPC